jgi:hypothetical protein
MADDMGVRVGPVGAGVTVGEGNRDYDTDRDRDRTTVIKEREPRDRTTVIKKVMVTGLKARHYASNSFWLEPDALPGKSPNDLDRKCRAAPSQKFKFFIFQRISSFEKFLQLINGPSW